MVKGYDYNQKSFYISTRSYIEQIFTSLQINKTLPQEQQYTPIWKAVHTASFLFIPFASPNNYFLKMVKMRNPIVYILYTTLRLS